MGRIAAVGSGFVGAQAHAVDAAIADGAGEAGRRPRAIGAEQALHGVIALVLLDMGNFAEIGIGPALGFAGASIDGIVLLLTVVRADRGCDRGDAADHRNAGDDVAAVDAVIVMAMPAARVSGRGETGRNQSG